MINDKLDLYLDLFKTLNNFFFFIHSLYNILNIYNENYILNLSILKILTYMLGRQ